MNQSAVAPVIRKRSINHALLVEGELRDACVHVEQPGHKRCRKQPSSQINF
jgi:hypothetical protein